MRLQNIVWAFISDDTAGEVPAAGSSNPETEREKLDGFTNYQRDSFSVAAAGLTPTVEELAFGNLAAPKGICLKADGAVTLRFNDGADSFTLAKPTGGRAAHVFLDTPITAVEVTNAGASAVRVTYLLWE